MLLPPPKLPDPEPAHAARPAWGSNDWGEIRHPLLQLVAAPLITFVALFLVVVLLPPGPWNLIPMFGPLTAIAILANRKTGIAFMLPILLIETFVVLTSLMLLVTLLLNLGPYD